MSAVDRVVRKYARGNRADDIRQIARITLWKAAETFDPSKGEWDRYAARAVKNAIVDEIRREVRRGPTMEYLDTALAPPDDPTDVLYGLDPLIVDFHVRDMSIDEMAAKRNMNRGTVWNHLRDARAALRDSL